ncbi:hypothetical protein MANES_10G125450v8 [Manihot esculenta]|uniref:Uncharacterized protein n=1 Tax=Manihot esculenta TaxID=3983 RepID=A0ACB7H074_MANES|nr:hypothetical protein MANES_10G125450v8 [Manihot esculenta]
MVVSGCESVLHIYLLECFKLSIAVGLLLISLFGGNCWLCYALICNYGR